MIKEIKDINTIHDIVHSLTASLLDTYNEDELRCFVYDRLYDEIAAQITNVVLNRIQENMTLSKKGLTPKS